jgi:hypothetical protein
LSTFNASSQENDWTIGSISKDGSKIVYEVFPTTVEMGIQSEMVLYTVLVEVTNIDSGDAERKRLFTTGCEKGSGKATIANLDGSLIDGMPIFDWETNGERVFDALSIRACAAYLLKMKKQRNSEPDAPVPNIHKQKPGLTV